MSLKDDLETAARTLQAKLRAVYGMPKARPDLTITRSKTFALIQGKLEPDDIGCHKRKLYKNRGFSCLKTTSGHLKFNKAFTRGGVTRGTMVRITQEGVIHWQVMVSIEEAPF